MAKTARTFLAIPIPDAQRDRLGRLQTLIATDLPGARWVEPKQFHITLGFLGEVLDTDLAALCRAIAAAAAPSPRFDLALAGLGAFPDAQTPRSVHVGVEGPGFDALIDLQARLAEATAALGYPPDARFEPHVTLGRLKGGKKHGPSPDLTATVNHFRRWHAGRFAVDQVVAYASTLTPEGPDHMALATAPLRGGTAGKHPAGP